MQYLFSNLLFLLFLLSLAEILIVGWTVPLLIIIYNNIIIHYINYDILIYIFFFTFSYKERNQNKIWYILLLLFASIKSPAAL